MSTNSTVNIANAVRNASAMLRNSLPVATTANVNDYSAPILNYTAVANEFLSVLVNRIILTIVRNNLYQNPLRELKKGSLPMGYSVQEITTNPVGGQDLAETENDAILTDFTPDVKAAYHNLSAQKVFPVTISNTRLKSAFTSWGKLEELIASIINALYSGANIYEFEQMKGLMQTAVTNNHITTVTTTAVSADNTNEFIQQLKALSSAFKYPSTAYNKYSTLTGATGEALTAWTPVERQRIMITSEAMTYIDVYSLAAAFNIDYVKFLPQIVEIDSFGTGSKIVACLFDEAFFQVYNNLDQMTEFYNAATLKWNYYWHVWRTFSYSPLVNAVALVTA